MFQNERKVGTNGTESFDIYFNSTECIDNKAWAINELFSIETAIKANGVSDSSVVFLCQALSSYSVGTYWWHKSIKQISWDARMLC